MFSQWIRISNHHDVYFKYLTILFVNYTSVKPKKRNKESMLSNIFIFQLEKPSVRKTQLSWNLKEK